MGLPQLPTDNLYKFAAIAGLVVIGFSIWFPATRWEALYSKMWEARAALEALKVDVDDIDVRLKMASKSARKPGPSDSVSLPHIDPENGRKLAEFRVRREEIQFLIKRAEMYEKASHLGLIFGGSLALWGFAAWYFKVQLPLDKALAKGLIIK